MSLTSTPNIIHNSARNATLAIVEINFCIPITALQDTIYVEIYTVCSYITILSDSCCVVGNNTTWRYTAIIELVFTTGSKMFGIQRSRDSRRKTLFPQSRKTHQIARTILCFQLYIIALAISEARFSCSNIHTTRITEVGRRLKDSTFLSVVKRYFIDIVKRELSKIYLSILRIAKFYAVIEYA